MTAKRYCVLRPRACGCWLMLGVCCWLSGCYEPPLSTESDSWGLDEIELADASPDLDAEPSEASGTDPDGPRNDRASGADAQQPFAVADDPWISTSNLPWQADYVHYQQGRQIGFSRVDVEESREQLRILRKDWILSSVGGQDSRTTIWTENKLEALESRSGQLREFTLSRTIGDSSETIKGNLRGTDLKVASTLVSGDDTSRRSATITWRPGTWGSLGIQSLLMREPMQAGQTRVATVLIPGMNQIAEVQLVAGSLELTPLAGGRAPELLPIDVLMLTKTADNQVVGTQSRNWVNEQGEIEKTLELTGARVTTFRVTRETTERLIAAVDMERMLDQRVELELPAGIAWDATSPLDGVFEIEMERMDPAGVFLRTSSQKVDSLDARSSRITVRASSLEEATQRFETNNDVPPTPEEKSPSQWIRSDHSLIKALGDRLAPADATPADIAQAATRLIAERIPTKSLDTSPPNSLNSLQSRLGDFIDHACLLTAVLRYRGIPARVVCGLKVQEGAIPRLVFWMWTEAWMDERWIGLDPTEGGPVGRGYLAIQRDALAEENPYTSILAVMRRLGAVTRAVLQE